MPQPNDIEYYEDGQHDPALKSRVNPNYVNDYEEEKRKSEADSDGAAQRRFNAFMPELRDYTLKDEFRDPFRTTPQVSRLQFT